jgi:putative ABC transport system substrate-binding protein
MTRRSRRRLLRGGLALAGLGLLSGCSLPATRAQPPSRAARIGFLTLGRADNPVPVPALEAFRQGLREHGWIEGRDITIEYRSAEENPERYPEVAAELVRLPVDVLVVAGGTQSALAAKQATDTIPIVLAGIGDPVAAGLVASFARPGGNVTGLATSGSEITSKRLDLLKEAVPGVSRIDFLWNPAAVGVQGQWAELQLAARALGVAVRSREARGPDELDSAFGAIAGERPDGLIVHGSPSFVPHARRIADFAADSRLPALYYMREFVESGGLLAYGPSLPDIHRRAATHVDKLLKGAKPADLPVEWPTRFDFVINLTTARAIGLTIPQSVLQQATEVIQ